MKIPNFIAKNTRRNQNAMPVFFNSNFEIFLTQSLDHFNIHFGIKSYVAALF